MVARLTVADRLLITAYRMGGEHHKPFSAEQLVVEAWQEYPESFGLRGILDDKGIPEYPDSNRVFVEIMGSKPLRRKGLLEKVSDKRYQITEAGKQRALALVGLDSYESVRRSIDRDLQNKVRRLMRTRAVKKLFSGRVANITFLDACSFWGISPRSSANDLKAKLANTKAILDQVRSYVGNKSVMLDRYNEVSSKEIDEIIELHSGLQVRFSEELNIIKQRTDERLTRT